VAIDDDRLKDAKRRMQGAVTALGAEFGTVRTGRASTSLLDRVQVEAYGTTSSRRSARRSRGC
jgi:ribosome recycling factor